MSGESTARLKTAGPGAEYASTPRPAGNARETALEVLTACRRGGAWADESLRARLDKDRLSAPDAALCSRIVYGVIQNRTLLDFYLAAYCDQKPERLQPPLPDILRLGAYQILFLDKVPDRAAVHESVELAKRAGRGKASGLVNAVLRRLAEHKDSLPPLPEGDAALALRYSHPTWLVRRLLDLLGAEETEAFLQCANSTPPITVQVNPLYTDAEELTRQLSETGVTVTPHPWVPDCLELTGAGNPAALPAFREGKFLVQDGAARLVTLAAGIGPGQAVLDVCAAPGGKSFSAAFAMGDRGRVLACDLHGNKLRRVREGAARLGLTCVETAAADGRVRNPAWEGQFDSVLVDAPCSGLGIIRKKPDIRWKREEELADLPAVQSAILRSASAWVRPGGVLVYSTCTILPEENQAVTEGFLAEHSEFSPDPFSLPSLGKTEGRITLWPQRHGTDGFYICRMVRQWER